HYRPLPRLLIGGVGCHAAGDKQYAGAADILAEFEGRPQRLDTLGSHLFAGVRQPLVPVDRIDDTGDDRARLADASLGLFRGNVARAIELDAVEAQLLKKLKLFEQRAAGPDHA